jgi:hypothetical protein
MSTGCSDKVSRTCGKKVNAKCVDYEGELHNNTELEECDCHNLEDVIEDLNTGLNTIFDAIDLSELGNDCLTYELENGKVLVKNALKKFEEEICKLKEATATDVDCNPIYTEDFTCVGLDLECLSDPCNNPITNLGDLLQAMITQICQNKSDIEDNHPDTTE